jgi:hypothetical protein
MAGCARPLSSFSVIAITGIARCSGMLRSTTLKWPSDSMMSVSASPSLMRG